MLLSSETEVIVAAILPGGCAIKLLTFHMKCMGQEEGSGKLGAAAAAVFVTIVSMSL